MQIQQVVFFKGDAGIKVKTPGAGKNMVEETVQTSTMERLYKLHYSQSRIHAWSPTCIHGLHHITLLPFPCHLPPPTGVTSKPVLPSCSLIL
jgi:hypothetical protein